MTANNYQEADINNLLQLWKLLNLQIILVLDNYPANRLHIRCDNGKTEVSLHTVEWLAGDYVNHLRHHLKDIMPAITYVMGDEISA